MRIIVLGLFLLSCGCGTDAKPTKVEDGKSEPSEPAPPKDKASGPKDKAEEPPIPKGKSDADLTRDLVGKWDGLQILRNSRGVVPIDGIVTLDDGGVMKFDGLARQGGAGRQIIGFGTWSVKSGQLVCVVEGSNVQKDIPNGSARTVQVREVGETELLYVDTADQRTYSAKRVTGATPAKPPIRKKN